jgi:hypothetical protein
MPRAFVQIANYLNPHMLYENIITSLTQTKRFLVKVDHTPSTVLAYIRPFEEIL